MTMALLTPLSTVATADLCRADDLVGEILGDILLVKANPEGAAIAGFQTRYAGALEKVLHGQFDKFESEGLRGEIDDIMAYAEKTFGKEVADKLRPDTENYLRRAFRAGQALKFVPDNIATLRDKPRQEALDWLVKHDRFWIGKVFPEHLSKDFRDTIVDGLNRGLGRKDIGRRLRESVLGKPGLPAKQEYYTRIASTSVNRARNWGAVFSLQTAGFTEYEIRAVMDERTSPICRFMNGKVFRVQEAVNQVERALSSPPSAIESIAPWPRYDAKRGDHYLSVDGSRRYLSGKSSRWMANRGLSLPPYHANCRATYIVTRKQSRELEERPREEKQIVSAKVPPFKPFTEKELAGKKAAELRMLAREKNIKYFRVMNKSELRIVLTNPGRCEEIARIAKARWHRKTIPDPRAGIARLAGTYRKKGVRELMEAARAKGIKNFRVMTKDQLVTVLSDPSKHDEIQRAVRAKLRAARGIRGKKPKTTRAEELGLEDVVARKKNAIQEVLSQADSHGKTSQKAYKRRLKKWLEDFNLDHLEAAAEKGLEVGAWDSWKKVPWRGRAKEFAGLYWRERYRMALISKSRGVFNHEFGHFLDDILVVTRPGKGKLPVTAKRAVGKALTNARKRALAQMIKRDSSWRNMSVFWDTDWRSFWKVPNLDTVSAYGLSDPAEFWAECVESYMAKGNRLRVKEPEMYKIIKKHVFNGKEFLK
jgi:SPP1 gp7 family putative phage head morphogenesis protein